jgi:hypothetical protein
MKTKRTAAPRFVLRRMNGVSPEFYICASGAGTSRREESWTPDAAKASGWTSRYAAKEARNLVGMSQEDCLPQEVK